MFGACPVVQVVWDNPEGFTEINKHDFDPKKHKLYEPPKPKEDTSLTVEELKAKLSELKVDFPATAKKEDLVKLLADNTK